MITALHTHGGVVWATEGEQSPRSTELPPADYRLPPGSRARLLGTAENAPLILSLAAQGAVIDLAGPSAVCPDAADLRDPVIVLYRTRQCLLGASLGGWHRYVAASDGPVYRLAGAAVEERVAIAADHPIWYDLQFLTRPNQRALADVLAEIVDPRWFVDARNPNRYGRLRCFFRIRPQSLHKLRAGDSSPGIRRFGRLLDVIGDVSNPSDAPGDFLRRVAGSAASPDRGLLSACRLLLAYVVRVWEQRIQILSQSRQTEPLFLPELLFRDFEAQGWREFDLARPR